MSVRPRILITGFGAFPGAPYNPTPALVDRLLQLRRPAFAEIERIGHVFPVSYRAVDHELPELLARHRPDALLMFGLAARTPYLRIETRARNAVSMLWPDVAHCKIRSLSIEEGAEAQYFGPLSQKLLRAALATGIDARASRDAGRYLCNYLGWRAIESTRTRRVPRLAAFVHVPLVPRPGSAASHATRGRITAEQLVDAGEAILLALLTETRRNFLEHA
uniref:Pyrrolidone-carboxylate peptidase n=1 Tax=Rhodopseudomonas palustris (strain BisA53) TaxID=316055 RepID=Q07QJ1_RHOP5